MTPIEQPGIDLPDNLPLLTQVADENTPDDLPTLTEIVAKEPAGPAIWLQPETGREIAAHETAMPASCALGEEEMQRLLRHLETYIENIFTYQLNLNLEQMHRTAIQHAVSDLKAELPELLRDALRGHPEL